MATKPGHSRTDSGHLPLGGGTMLPRSRPEADQSNEISMSRTGSTAPLLMNAPSLQPQAFGALLEQARQMSGKLVGPNLHSLEIEAEPSEKAGPSSSSWDNPPSSRRTQSFSGNIPGLVRPTLMQHHTS